MNIDDLHYEPECPPYLQVRADNGDLLGLMKGIPVSACRRQWITFRIDDPRDVVPRMVPERSRSRTVDLQVDVLATGGTLDRRFYALRVSPDVTHADLSSISMFR